VFEFAFERCCQKHDQQVRRSVQGNGHCAEHDELQEDVACGGRDELRDEREKEKRGLGIQGFGEDALTESVLPRAGGSGFEFGVASADHADAEIDKVGGSGIFHGVERDSTGGEDRGDTESGGKDMEQSSNERAKGGKYALAAAASEAACEHVEDAGPRRDGQQEGGGEKQNEVVSVNHSIILPADVLIARNTIGPHRRVSLTTSASGASHLSTSDARRTFGLA